MGAITKKVIKPTKKAKTAEKPLEDVNKTATLQKIVIHRELKYKYPKGMTDPLKRKSHRAKIRNKLRNFAMQIVKLTGDARKKLEEGMALYQKENTYY